MQPQPVSIPKLCAGGGKNKEVATHDLASGAAGVTPSALLVAFILLSRGLSLLLGLLFGFLLSLLPRRKGGIEVQERIVGAGRAVEDLTEEDVLAYLLPELSLILR